MRIDSLTDIGVKRKDNQDNYWSAILDVNGSEAGIVCICDGMGGLNNGGLASKMVVEAVRNHMLNDFDFSFLDSIISKVNLEILDMSGGDKSKLMGTTCTVLLCHKGTYYIFHIGDSRAYKVNSVKSELLTVDHSAVKEYNIRKQENPELWNRYKNKLTRCIGVKDTIFLDYYTGSYVDGDAFLLCSDGCWHLFDDVTLNKEMILNLPNLIKSCIANGETDNITVGVLHI